MTAPAIASTAVVLALALAWYRNRDAEPPPITDDGAQAIDSTPTAADLAGVAVARSEQRGSRPAPFEAPVAEAGTRPAPAPERAPLPGETPPTPMTQLLTDRQNNVIIRRTGPSSDVIPPGLTQGEREFAAEPIDTTWAPGAEANLMAQFAQMPGLKLIDLQVECRSTMCRLQLTQPREAPGEPTAGARPFNLLRDSIDTFEPRWMMFVGDGTGPMKSVAYLWREGFARRECFKDGQPTPCSAEAVQSTAEN